jgi:uncharacterized DUF497 family protein
VDDAKAAQNLASHGVSFEAAQLAFDDPFAVVRRAYLRVIAREPNTVRRALAARTKPSP